MRLSLTVCLVGTCALLTGCAQHYTPKISLGESPQVIPLRVELHPLKDSPKAPGQPYGVVAEHVKTAEPGELSVPITDAILEDFRQNYVFQQVDAHVEHPDAILTGTISTFYETYRPKGWTQVPYAKSAAKLMDVDTYTATTKVDIDVVLRTPDGARIGTYHGHAAKTDEFTPNKQNQPGARSDWALSEAIHQIRQALLDDPNVMKYSAQAGRMPERQNEHAQ
ncbi:MAG: YajG family lipoprotein [Nitrospirota bacterium]|nr:YajG family lipoprotein [Nitrospirota bacterium]